MTSTAHRLARPEVLALPAFDLSADANARFPADAIRLDANENPFGPLVEGSLAAGVNRYPEPQPAALLTALAGLYGVAPDNLVLGRGADEGIDLLCRAFCRPGLDAVAICPPTFGVYAHFAALQGARVVEVPLMPGWQIDGDALSAAGPLKLVFLCSPNNPTGDVIPAAEVLRLVDAMPDTIVVLDEAYVEFAEAESLAREAAARPNLAVLRTLSKAYGLAGARVGAVIAAPETIALLRRVSHPYPLPSPSIAAALAALSPSRRPLHARRIAEIKAERRRLAAALRRAAGVTRVHEAEGNFLLLEVVDAAEVARRLQALAIRVRFRPKVAPGAIRLSVGTPAENDAALAAFGIGETARPRRTAEVTRDTRETRIAVALDLDRDGPRAISTGVPYYDHMLDQVAAHGGFSAVIACEGDLEIDPHHSIEDVAIALGTALKQALGDRRGIGRFGFALPMDETRAEVLIDLSGRPFARFEGSFAGSHVGDYPTEMTPHVFRSIADSLGAAIHVRVDGDNDHHKVEACFKAFGRALRQAIAVTGGAVPSTKGVL